MSTQEKERQPTWLSSPDWRYWWLWCQINIFSQRKTSASTILTIGTEQGDDFSEQFDIEEEESDGDDQFMPLDLFTLDVWKSWITRRR